MFPCPLLRLSPWPGSRTVAFCAVRDSRSGGENPPHLRDFSLLTWGRQPYNAGSLSPGGVVLKHRTVVLAVLGSLCLAGLSMAQTDPFVGVLAGVSTLSADGRSITTGSQSAVSLYKPENGPAVNVFAGVHLTDYLSIQGNYVWDRNRLTLTSTQASESSGVFYEQSRTSAQHAVIADLLLYFRNRRTWFRPYLSVGSGFVYFTSREQSLHAVKGSPRLPPQEFDSAAPALRVAVGMDFALRGKWALRYSFSETIRSNPVSEQLSPPGQRNLANFQNLFGIFRRF